MVVEQQRTRNDQIRGVLSSLEHLWLMHPDESLTAAIERTGFRFDDEDDTSNDDLLEKRLRDYLKWVMSTSRDVT